MSEEALGNAAANNSEISSTFASADAPIPDSRAHDLTVEDLAIQELANQELSNQELSNHSTNPAQETAPDWREELAAKMQNYRARRKPREPKYPSLQIPLHLPVGPSVGRPLEAFSGPFSAFDSFQPTTASASRSSLALEPVASEREFAVPGTIENSQAGPELVETATDASAPAPPTPAPTNLIEFPRSMDFEAWDGLAEPLVEQPRILEAPELSPPAPALGGILLGALEGSPVLTDDRPPCVSAIGRRILAALVDLVFVCAAVMFYEWITIKIAHEIPSRSLLLVSAGVALVAFWLGYQYLLMTYSGTTLGLRACSLELVAVDGSVPGRKQRRWRLLASLLSASSMMFGYAWALLDEEQMCWHDRISRTYLRVQEQEKP